MHSSQKVKSSANTSYQNKLSFNQNDPKGKDITGEKHSSPLYMQNVITSTSLSNNGRLDSDNETITHDDKVCGDPKIPSSTHQIRGTSSEPRPTHSNDASVDLDQQLLSEGFKVKRIINYRVDHNQKFDEKKERTQIVGASM